ncbi:hypothetical protein F2S72_08895 [Pseudomonas syringae pv. actinidiae]|nr:hypothetical protein [Pseudomonas syringae pv. actinidiae]
MQNAVLVQEISREDVERIAQIMGTQSASAQALAEFDRRTAAGETVKLYRGKGSMFVGPDAASAC